MRRGALPLIAAMWLACDVGPAEAPAPPAPREAPAAAQPAQSSEPTGTADDSVMASVRPQPKPGERVRQPELDGYCVEEPRPLAFYYHGGAPVTKVAREDRCAPLYIGECESTDNCYPPRDQEPGMWCCGSAPAASQQQARR